MAAVGLAIVALALNQSWPLIPGSAIPGLPPKHQSVSPAVVVASPAVPSSGVRAGRLARPGRNHARPGKASVVSEGGAGTPASGPSPTVVSQSTPVTPPQSAPHDQSPPQNNAPGAQHRAAETPTTVAAAPSPPEPAPTPTPTPAPEASPPASAPPVSASVEPPEEESESSDGHGHGYGREDGWHDHESDEYDGHDHGWGDEASHGHD